jgi:hypothetical protein
MTRILLAALSLALCSIVTGSESPVPRDGFIAVPGGPVWYEAVEYRKIIETFVDSVEAKN